MAEGFSLNISAEILKKLDEADEKLQRIATHSEEVSKNMKKLSTDGINSVVKSLTDMNAHLTTLSKNNGLSSIGAQASQSVDAINKMIAALAQLTTQQQLRLQTQQSRLDYKKEANDIKELTIAENERARALDRQNKANIANDKHKQALETKKLANDTKELMNIEQERGRQLILQNKKSIASYAKQSTKLKQQIDEINRLAKAYKQMPTKLKQIDLNKIITGASKAKTINQHIVAIHNLQNALKDLDTTSKNYSNNVKRINAEIQRNRNELSKLGVNIDKVKNQKRKLIDTAGQLQRKLSLLFSVSQIVGYFNKMVSIRKEMELQQKSLQVLLQNKDEADKLWNQVLDLAVKSPFRVKELVTYTKQLAAYRIESDQLFDTTKRLSDVSAGLGVDMQRLILAYGQIRAAGFLRGTELRQLTEAGLPMLDELSKYLTEIEGRTIRTGDVFEMISKRMVSFKDVQEVFKRMTNEGGVFFNMQEEQAKTLAGSISNLHDSIDLMLNDIGRANDETLKGSIAFARSLVSNWREVQAAMEFILALSSPFLLFWGLAKVASSGFAKSLLVLAGHSKLAMKVLTAINPALSKYTAHATAAGAATKILRTALGGLTTLGIGFAIYYISDAILSLYLSATKANRIAEELKKNLNNIIKDDLTNLEKQVNGFKDLSTRLGEANEGSQERREIISALNSQYGEYLDFVVNETTSMDELAKSYDKVVDRMKERAALASFEKGFQAINDSYGKQLEDATEDFYSIFRGASIRKEIDGIVGFTNIVPTKKEVDDIFNLIQQKIREKNIEEIDSLEEQRNLLDEIIKGYYGETFSLSQMPVTTVDLIDIFVKRKKDELRLQEQINQEYKKTLQSQEANLAFEQLQNEYALKQKEIRAAEGLSQFEVNKQLKNLKTQFELDKIELKFRFGEISQNEMIDAKNKIWKWASETVMAVNEQIERELAGKFSEEEYSQIMISQEEYEKGMSAILKNTVENYELHNKLLMDEISLKDASKQFDEDKIKKYERLLELDKFRAKALGIELDLVQKIDQESVKSINSQLDDKYQISLENSYKSVLQLQEEANKKRQDAIKLEAALLLQRERGVAIGESTLQQVQADVAGWTKLWELLGGAEKEKKQRTYTNSLYDERIKVIDDMNKKYKELNKTLSRTEALQGAFDAYKDAFADAYGRNDVRQMTAEEFAKKVLNFPNENDIVKWLDNLAKTAKNKEDKIKVELAKGEYVFDMKVRVKEESDKALIDQIEDMFSGYEMSIELQKLNIPPDLAKQLFNIDSIDLSGLKSRVEGLQSLFIGTDMEGKYKEYLQKISEMEEKEQVERLKSYTKYIVKAQSERARITFEALEKIRKAEEMHQLGKFNETEMNNIRENINKERDKELADLAFNEFKNSDLYLKMFEDFDSVSIPVLEAMKERVENLRKSLKELGASSEDVKNLTQQLEKIDDAIQERNPFKDLFKNIKEYRKLQGERDKTELEYKEQLEENEKLTKALAEASKEVGAAKSEYNKAMEQAAENQTLKNAQTELDIAKARLAIEINANGAETQKAIALQQEVERKQQAYDLTYKTLVLENESVKTATKRLDNANKTEESAKKALNKSNTDLSALLSKLKDMEELSEKIAATLQFVGQVFQELASTVTDVASSLENVFGAMDAKTSDTISSISEILGGLGNTASGIGRVMANPMDIGGYFQAISGLASTIGSIFAIGDKKKERQIQREIKFVEDLERAYQKLEKAIDNAYTFDTLKGSYDAAQKNIDEQIASYNKMIAAEEDKKKTDKDRIKEWQQAIKDLSEERKELLKSQVEELGGGYDYSAMTEEFVNAWLDAFKETGNGLSGLEDNFEDFWQNIAMKQAVMGGASKIMQPFLDAVNNALENDFKLDDSEMANIDQLSAKAKEDMNAFLEQWYNKWGDFMTQGEQSELSGLQRGIQELHESTGQEIAAYLNSIRFFVADSNTKLSQIASFVIGGDDTINPMLSELKTQTEMIRAIRDMFGSVIKQGHSTFGGAFLKVSL